MRSQKLADKSIQNLQYCIHFLGKIAFPSEDLHLDDDVPVTASAGKGKSSHEHASLGHILVLFLKQTLYEVAFEKSSATCATQPKLLDHPHC